MKSILSAAVLAALFTSITSGVEREREVRGVVMGPNAPALAPVAGPPKQYHLHDAAGTKKLGSIVLNFGVLGIRADPLAASQGALVLTTDPDPKSVKNPRQVIGTFAVPAKAQSMILLLVPRGADLFGSQILAIDEGAKAFPMGSIKAVNLSPGPVGFWIENKMSKVGSGEAETIATTDPNNPGGFKAVTCSSWQKQSWRPFYASRWPLDPNKRSIQIVYPVPGKPGLEVARITE